MTMDYSPWLPKPRATPAKRGNPEQQIQTAFFKALRVMAAGRVFAWAIPNEGRRSQRNGAQMKAAGLTAGAPDVCATWWDETHGRARVMWLEFKAPKGRLTEHQTAFHERLRAQGHLVETVRSADEALTALRAQGAPLAEVKL